MLRVHPLSVGGASVTATLAATPTWPTLPASAAFDRAPRSADRLSAGSDYRPVGAGNGDLVSHAASEPSFLTDRPGSARAAADPRNAVSSCRSWLAGLDPRLVVL